MVLQTRCMDRMSVQPLIASGEQSEIVKYRPSPGEILLDGPKLRRGRGRSRCAVAGPMHDRAGLHSFLRACLRSWEGLIAKESLSDAGLFCRYPARMVAP
jgi:hypothetical protein